MHRPGEGELNQELPQPGAVADLGEGAVGTVLPVEGEAMQRNSGEGQVGVLVELLRQISSLSSEEPDAIMRLFVRLDETYELGLVEDRVFIGWMRRMS
jgi:hypothetical protein